MKYANGSVTQSGLNHQLADYNHEHIFTPVLGVVLSVYASDDPLNSGSFSAQDRRGFSLQAKVKVVQDGVNSSWILPNVTILPNGSTGHDDYAEEVPRGTTGTINGSEYDENTTPPRMLNGDWCVVAFIGGSIHQPVMLSWFPHPANRKDALTITGSNGNLVQDRRIAKRFQGTRLVVTSEGTILVDTTEANYRLKEDRKTREINELGGDIRVTVKNDREFELNFNQSVFGDPAEEDFLWGANQRSAQERETTSTKLLMDKDFIRAVAGQVAEIYAGENAYIGKQGEATENLVLGQALKSLLSSVLQALATHTHFDSFGGTGPPMNSSDFTSAKASVDAEDQLSTWAFTQKDPPAL